MAEKRRIKAGDEVNLVLASGRHATAKINRVDKNGLADLEFEHDGRTQQITSSPLDESGTRPDCWCPKPVDGPAAA